MRKLIQKIQPRIMRFLAVNAVLRQMVYCARFVQLLLELPDFVAVSAHEPRELVDNSGIGCI